MPALLTCQELTKRFGALVALDGVSFEMAEGEIFGIAGPNGAGKTTLFNVLAGVHRGQGRALFRGNDIIGLRSHQVCRLGIARTFQIPEAFPSLPVSENVRIGAHFGAGLSGRDEEDEVRRAVEFVGLGDAMPRLARELKLLDKKRTMLAAALATRPGLLLVDEPMSGLNPTEMKETVELFRRINGELGIGIIIIEHFMKVLSDLASRLLILNFGQTVCIDQPEVVLRDPRVIECYLGDDDA